MHQNIIYSLNTDDIQHVAHETIGRRLSEKEIELITASLEKRINWYDLIEISILENINNKQKK